MINCGGDINIASELSVAEDTLFYVVDSRRPYHHINVLGVTSQVIVLGDDEPETKAAEEISAYIADVDPKDIEADSDSDSENDAEAEDPDQGEAQFGENPPSPVQDEDDETKSQDSQVDEETNDENKDLTGADKEADESGDGDSDEEPNETRKRARSGASKSGTSTLSLRRAKRQKFREYYKGTFYGQPAAHTAHVLAEQVSKGSSNSLWLSMVGSTHHYLNGHLNNDRYNLYVLSYKTQLNSYSEGRGGEYKLDDGTVVPTARSCKIEYTPELRLMLHRHWSLYNALYFSDYVASRLGIWKSNGKSTLKTFLARMGISLKECNQKFSFMSVRLKTKLRDKIMEHMQEFDLDDILYSSFQYQGTKRIFMCGHERSKKSLRNLAGFDTLVSAADVTHAVQALLEQPKVESSAGDENKDANASQEEVEAEKLNKMSKAWLENFNEAYESLASHDHAVSLLKKGITVSMDLQRGVVSEAIAIMEGRLVQSAGDFR